MTPISTLKIQMVLINVLASVFKSLVNAEALIPLELEDSTSLVGGTPAGELSTLALGARSLF